VYAPFFRRRIPIAGHAASSRAGRLRRNDGARGKFAPYAPTEFNGGVHNPGDKFLWYSVTAILALDLRVQGVCLDIRWCKNPHSARPQPAGKFEIRFVHEARFLPEDAVRLLDPEVERFEDVRLRADDADDFGRAVPRFDPRLL
jgi:hypothetical protein